MMNNKDRSSKFEVLRIIAMLCIVLFHCAVYSHFEIGQGYSFNKLLVQFAALGGRFGVDCFILITGYFMCKSNLKLKKMLNLYLQILFYSLGIYLVLLIIGIEPFSLKNFIKSCFPIITTQYWFASAYVLLYFLSPFINIFVRAATKKQLGTLIMFMFVWLSVIPTFLRQQVCFNELLWFVFLYLVSSFIRIYSVNGFKNNIYNLIGFIGSYIFSFVIVVFFDFIGINMEWYFAQLFATPMLIAAIMLFIFVKRASMKNNEIVNLIATSTFGVYLIHDNNYLRNILWNDICKSSNYYNSVFLIVHLIACVVMVFCMTALVDILRNKTIGEINRRILGKFEKRLSNKK